MLYLLPLFFAILTIFDYAGRNRRWQMLVSIPTTLFWIANLFLIVLPSGLKPVTGWIGEVIFNLLSLGLGLLSLGCLIACLASYPRGPAVNTLAMLAGALVSCLLAGAAYWKVEADRTTYVFYATDPYGQPITAFSLAGQIEDKPAWRLDGFRTTAGQFESDRNGEVRITVFGTHTIDVMPPGDELHAGYSSAGELRQVSLGRLGYDAKGWPRRPGIGWKVSLDHQPQGRNEDHAAGGDQYCA